MYPYYISGVCNGIVAFYSLLSNVLRCDVQQEHITTYTEKDTQQNIYNYVD